MMKKQWDWAYVLLGVLALAVYLAFDALTGHLYDLGQRTYAPPVALILVVSVLGVAGVTLLLLKREHLACAGAARWPYALSGLLMALLIVLFFLWQTPFTRWLHFPGNLPTLCIMLLTQDALHGLRRKDTM